MSSAVVLVDDDIPVIIAMRAIAGIGAAAVMPMTLSIITRVFPPEERGRAVGIWSGVTVGGALIGLLTAGGLLEAFSWRSVFAFNVGLTAITLAATLIVPGKTTTRANGSTSAAGCSRYWRSPHWPVSWTASTAGWRPR
ncbi:MFS transporter [Nocardia pneumoniae]|uniref:MFS transporter n=1 Tax=Nocardia pneumoniae TaxID=228601 RepID=UPI0012F64730|nr:MFS transporter [Nocardia pneumoniae]